MKVKIFTLQKGLEEYDDVNAIRIKSSDYNLLILKDYLPIMGKLEGDFEFEVKDNKVVLNNIIAYYVNENNVFNIIIEGR